MSNKHLFISYALADGEFASELGDVLRRRGAVVYSDKDMQPGGPWLEALRDQIQKSSALVLIIPSRLMPNRNNIWFEAGAAKAFGKKVLAVLPPHQRLSRDLPTDLADLLVLDTDERPLESVADTLLQAA